MFALRPPLSSRYPQFLCMLGSSNTSFFPTYAYALPVCVACYAKQIAGLAGVDLSSRVLRAPWFFGHSWLTAGLPLDGVCRAFLFRRLVLPAIMGTPCCVLGEAGNFSTRCSFLVLV